MSERILKEILVDMIVPDPDQPRRVFDEAKLAELADSIREHGVIQPIEVEEMSRGRYMIHHGERRWRASKLAGLARVPAIVAQPITDDVDRLARGIVENVQRADLNPIEEGLAYQRLMDIGRMSVAAVARMVNKSQPLVKGRMVWLKLPEEIQEMVADGRLPKSPEVAEALLGIEEEAQLKLASRAAGSGISIKQFRAVCARIKKEMATADMAQRAQSAISPALVLALNGDARPPESGRLRWGKVRKAAGVMCDKCSLRDMTRGVPEPAWMLAQAAIEETCQACDVRGDLQICRECPGVDLVKRLVRLAKEEEHV